MRSKESFQVRILQKNSANKQKAYIMILPTKKSRKNLI